MEANELRLGNLFIEENSSKIISVIGLEKNRIVFDGIFLDKWQAKPITLTDEWLIKFGFIKTESFAYYNINSNLELINISNKYFRAHFMDKPIKKYIQYLHQIQNLYFELTGDELNFIK